MPPLLKLITIGAGQSVEIVRAPSGSLSIGREPENTVAVDSESMSRQHGQFLSAGEQWCFVDSGSTNGSWVNGVQVAPGSVRLLHNGDLIQMADFVVQVLLEYPNESRPDARSLIIFRRDTFVEERSLLSAEDRLVIGGPEGDLFIEGESTERPQLVIAVHEGQVELTVDKIGPSVLLNTMAVAGTSKLTDRDEVVVGPFRFVMVDDAYAREHAAAAQSVAQQAAAAGTGASVVSRDEHVGDWEDVQSKAVGRKFVFGSPPENVDVEGTISVRRDEIAGSGFGLGPASRMMSTVGEEESNEGLGEKFSILLGVIAILVLIGGLFLFLGNS